MSLLTTCYGPDIDTLADEDGGFESVSTDTLLEFVLRQWKSVAATLGFSSARMGSPFAPAALARALRAAVNSARGNWYRRAMSADTPTA